MPYTHGRSLQECKQALLEAIQSGDLKPWLVVGAAESSFFRWLQKDTQLNTTWYGTLVVVSSAEAKKFFSGKPQVQESKPKVTRESGSARESQPAFRESQPKPKIVPIVKSCIVTPRATERQKTGFFHPQTIICRAEFCSDAPGASICKIQNRFTNLRDDSDAGVRYYLWLESLTARYANRGNVSGRGWRWLDDAPKPQNTNQLVWSR
ncbi:MAG: hypothetical protein ACKO24_00815 [Leptolyngbyaceae cyanobacterium]